MPDPFQNACTIDDGGFMQLRRYAGKRGNIENGIVAKALPYAGPDVNSVKVFFLGHIIDGWNAEQTQKLIDQSRAGIGELNDHATQNHGGNKVGQITDVLHQLGIAAAGHMIQAKGKNRRQRKGQQRVKIDDQRIANDRGKVIVRKEFLEIFESDPGTLFNAPGNAKFTEGNLSAVHRNVLE